MTRQRSRRRHRAAVILVGTGLLVMADLAAWALWALWHVLPLLLSAGAAWAAYRARQRHPSGGGQ
jgi:hypothetical protein